MLAFLRNMVGVKTDRAVQGALETLVSWDPQGATEAELRTMEQQLDGLGLQVAQARSAYEREQREADAIAALSQQRMAAAEELKRRVDAATDPGRKHEIEGSLSTLLDLLEKMTPEVEREAKDAAEARDFLETLENAYAEAGAKLKEARGGLERAQRDMARAAQQRETAERRADAARQAAGLGNATSGLGTALKAMQNRAQRDLESAEAANAKAQLLRPTTPERDDPNISAAMAAASGSGPRPRSLSERLEALRGPAPAGALPPR